MKCRPLGLALIVLSCIVPSRADTITTRNHISVNGKLVSMNEGQLKVIARYASETKTLSMKIEQVEMIEFNATTFNSSSPSKGVGLGPPLANQQLAEPKANETNTIFLRGSHKSCILIGIDERFVQCKDGSYNRAVVLRIVTGVQ